MLRRWLRRLLLGIACLCVLLGLAYLGWVRYLVYRERVSPSSQQVLMLKDGSSIPLIQPTAIVAERPLQRPAAATSAEPVPSASPRVMTRAVLPPVRVVIPGIEVDWPVVLSTNEHLPRFKGVGWFFGSAFPGATGNMVLFGHLGGQHGTFMRLHELQPGDEFHVMTEDGAYRYRVRDHHETSPDDVSALAPTHTATATLITCSGPWDPITQTNERRLIVTAEYIGMHALTDSTAFQASP